MENFNSEKLQAFLDLLVESGVEEFEGYGIHVRFTPAMFTPDKQVAPSSEEVLEIAPRPNRIWEQPELWPGGKPPSFPK